MAAQSCPVPKGDPQFQSGDVQPLLGMPYSHLFLGDDDEAENAIIGSGSATRTATVNIREREIIVSLINIEWC